MDNTRHILGSILLVSTVAFGCELKIGDGGSEDPPAGETGGSSTSSGMSDTDGMGASEGGDHDEDDEEGEAGGQETGTGETWMGTTSGWGESSSSGMGESGSSPFPGYDPCEFANDGECDEPDLCEPDTDWWDCGYCPWARDGECDEEVLCPAESDYWDCGFCPFEDDGDCDDDGKTCPAGTDVNDCA